MRKLLSLIVISGLLIVIFNLAKGSFESYTKLSQVTGKETDLKSLQLKNSQLKKKLTADQSDFYFESQARDKLGYGRSGETIIVVKDSEINANKSEKEKKENSNIEKWLKLLKISL
jgi:cell division protein FtsB